MMNWLNIYEYWNCTNVIICATFYYKSSEICINLIVTIKIWKAKRRRTNYHSLQVDFSTSSEIAALRRQLVQDFGKQVTYGYWAIMAIRVIRVIRVAVNVRWGLEAILHRCEQRQYGRWVIRGNAVIVQDLEKQLIAPTLFCFSENFFIRLSH